MAVRNTGGAIRTRATRWGSPAADERDHFHGIFRDQSVVLVIGLPDDLAVDLDGTRASSEIKEIQKARHGRLFGGLAQDAVDGNLHLIMIG